MPAGNRVKDSEEVRIERRLIEHLAADPVAAGNPLRPLVVGAGVAQQHREERRAANRCDMNQADQECRGENRRSVADEA